MINFIKKIPKNIITCLTILAVVLIILYLIINRDKLSFEHYEDETVKCPLSDKSIACNIYKAVQILS